MADFIPYSEKQQILPPDIWEQYEFLDQDCVTARVAAQTMRAIISRLAKVDKTGKDVNIDDFEFLIYEDKGPNAEFISAQHTRNGKNVIAITTGITDLCKNEDQLAGVLGHEFGHYAYSKIYGNNKNTIFQEHGADLFSLKTMIAGGYNPAAYSEVCEEMRRSSGRSISLGDVHGSNMCRKEEVEDWLANERKKNGEFKVLAPTGEYNKLAKALDKSKDKYKSYFTQLMEHRFPKLLKNPSYNPPISQVLDLIVSELKNGKLNNYQRQADMIFYIRNRKKTKRTEIRRTQQFLEELADLYDRDPVLKKQLHYGQFINLCSDLKTKFRDNKPFEIFGAFQKDLDKIEEFMTTRDPVRVKEFVQNFYDKGKIQYLKRIFGKPAGFKMPSRHNAKGQIMPTAWLYTNFHGTDLWYDIKSIIRDIGFEPWYPHFTDQELKNGDEGSDFGGKIITTNEQKIKEIKLNIHNRLADKEIDTDFKNFMLAINLLYDFDQGKISAQEMNNIWVQNISAFSAGRSLYRDGHTDIAYWLHPTTWFFRDSAVYENIFLRREYRELNNSKAFAEMYIRPFLKMVKQALYNIDPKLANEVLLDNPPKGKTWLEYVQDVSKKYLKIREYLTKSKWYEKEEKDDKIGMTLLDVKRKLGYQSAERDIWNTQFGPLFKILCDTHTDIVDSAFKKFVDAAVKDGVYSAEIATNALYHQIYIQTRAPSRPTVDRNKTLTALFDLQEKNTKKLQHDSFDRFSVYASRKGWLNHDDVHIATLVEEEIENKTDLHNLHRLLKTFGMLANNEQELIEIFSKAIPNLIQNSGEVSSEVLDNGQDLMEKLKEYALIYYMRKKAPIKDLYPILFAACMDKNSKFRAKFANELGEYIKTNNLIPTDFKRLYDLYVIMEEMNVFSRDRPLQAQTINALIAHVQKMPPQAREEYAWRLLSGFYYPGEISKFNLNRSFDRMDITLAKNKLLEIYSDTVAERLGRDDNSDKYLAKIQELLEFINQKHICLSTNIREQLNSNKLGWEKIYNLFDKETELRKGIDKQTQAELYRLITDKIQSQERVTQLFADDKLIKVSDKDAQSNDRLARVVNTLLDVLAKSPELARYTIDFLNEKLTMESMHRYCDKCDITANYQQLSISDIENFYNTFWSYGIEMRAVIMKRLLNRAFETLDEKIEYACDLNFGKENKYRKDVEQICDCVIKSCEPYEQTLILAALASAGENNQDGKTARRSVGDGLRMFFENMGPAWVKFGQLLSYVPNLPSEIRHDLGNLKDKADIPARWDVYEWMHEAMPEDLFNRIERVEEIIGAGSFWITAVIQIKNNQGKTEKKVIQLLRPNADARTRAGFKTIEKAINKLVEKNASKYKILSKVAHQARDSAKYEVDVNVGSKQYSKAEELYGDIRVTVDGTEYTPRVAKWRNYGVGKDGMAYKVMDYANGATLSRAKVSDDERRKMALAYFTIELVVLFKGDVWDIDRHQGQQNFDIISPTNVDINIYDTGAQLPNAPDKKNKMLLANIFFGLAHAVQSGTSNASDTISEYLLKTIKRLDKLQDALHVDVSYVSNVEKGLMALSDIIEYQKEIKDKDGNIIQERKILSPEDLKYAVVAVLQNSSVDKHMSAVIKGRTVVDKLKRLELKALKELANSPEFGKNSPVQITILDSKVHSPKVIKLNKSAEEIKLLLESEDTIMGVPKKHIDFNPDNSSTTVIEPPTKDIA